MIHAGHCLCGAIRFSFTGVPNWVLHCHCESCRRATASAMTTFVSVPDSHVVWSGPPPARFASSPGVTRGFCPTCGSPLFYRNDRLPGETHLYAALLDDPGALTPEGHDFIDERIAWMHPLPDTRPPHA
ncbi:MAG: GFA family protein [Amaricoccus sp.]|uniref:GFA family protein n=1 Tax=Amaricoccus sp. TaxID=1872485 RepID=UPI0039E3F5B7